MHDPVALARDLIRFPSVTPQEAGALAFLAGRLQAAGFSVHRETFSEAGTPDVENLYARIGDSGPHLVFAGHTDVVPPGDEAAWTHRPFEAALANDQVYGRGAVDMKGAIASFVAAVLDHLSENGGKPRGSISFLITGDEEGPGVNGTKKLLEWAKARSETFDHCVLGEPTNPEKVGDMIKIGRRGSLSGTLTVSGKQGHVAYPHLADNPIRYLVRIMSEMMAETLDLGTEHFDASNLEFTSVDVGNRATNVIPGEASARFNIRFNDRHTLKSLKEWIETRATQAARGDVVCRVDYAQGNSESFITQPGEFVNIIIDAIRDVTGRAPALSTSGGTSDARFIKNYCPVIEFGLVGQTMHQVDERVPTADLITLTAVYRRILDRYFGDGAER
ncbi:succinyl-diaminopimelate desuccinylase [Variibacter gotjawalensis]|uniref:succinyl-diaminopimelate desuccinylase n=1 Tax=Variibacter gotjawalensis TaxID=1333996 RepID=UPI0013EEDC46|nr:succinyl-diaminopimelate desuccinylase [Variibacter gotjawalensis]